MQGTTLKPDVQGFDSLKLRVNNHVCALSLSQGIKESLTLRGPSSLLSRIDSRVEDRRLEIELGGSLTDRIGNAFSTSLSRQKIEVDLAVRDLHDVDIGGFVEGVVFGKNIGDLNLAFIGLGSLKIAKLRGDFLAVMLKGSPTVQIDGEVKEQRVTVKGMGQYRAGNLKTQKTVVHISGSAFATVWAEAELSLDMQGMGSIEYYGRPSVSRKSIGMNRLKPLGVR